MEKFKAGDRVVVMDNSNIVRMGVVCVVREILAEYDLAEVTVLAEEEGEAEYAATVSASSLCREESASAVFRFRVASVLAKKSRWAVRRTDTDWGRNTGMATWDNSGTDIAWASAYAWACNYVVGVCS